MVKATGESGAMAAQGSIAVQVARLAGAPVGPAKLLMNAKHSRGNQSYRKSQLGGNQRDVIFRVSCGCLFVTAHARPWATPVKGEFPGDVKLGAR